jgi:hypothetical protein
LSRAINTGLIILVSLVVQLPLALGIAALLADRRIGAVPFHTVAGLTAGAVKG